MTLFTHLLVGKRSLNTTYYYNVIKYPKKRYKDTHYQKTRLYFILGIAVRIPDDIGLSFLHS